MTLKVDEDVKEQKVLYWWEQIREHLTVAGKVEDVGTAISLLGIYSREHFTLVQKDVHLAKL